ncbi:MAG: 16S rRNA (uracil(1498)-N(3))-methyltransferase [Salibacteraceae bacterium]
MTVFYLNDLTPDQVVLNPDQSKHAARVLRLKQGAVLVLSDGRGAWHQGELKSVGKHCEVAIVQRHFQPPDAYEIHLAVAPTKNMNRYEWLVEKATEIGMHQLLPFFSNHSERQQLKQDRVERVVEAAAKQSLRAYLPKVAVARSFESLMNLDFEGKKFIAHCQDSPRKLLKDSYLIGSNALVLIGPEGDFSPKEVAMALDSGFEPITLGNGRYRTETAALMACHTLHLLNQ